MPNHRFMATFAISFALIYCYSSVLSELAHKWKQDDMYSFGVLIPAISAYLIWSRRDDLNSIVKKADNALGFFVLISGLAILLLGRMTSIVVVQEFSLIISITGVVLVLFGRRTFYVIWFPILYLVFMIPFWDIILNPLHFPFQIISATLGVKIVNILGIPVFQADQFIELPNITLEVAELCSGVNYLISIIAIGIPLCYLFINRWSKRIILILFSVLVAVLSNGLRVAGVVLFTYYSGTISAENIHGPFDIFRSLIISMVGIGILCLGVTLLREEKSLNSSTIDRESSHVNHTVGGIPEKGINPASLLPFFTVLLIIATGYRIHSHEPARVSLEKGFSGFPYEIEEWRGKDSEFFLTAIDFKEMGVTDELSRVYENPSGREFNLYVGYFDHQDQEKELISNKLDTLFKHSKTYSMDLSAFNINVVNIYNNYRDVKNRFILHWFDINGRKTFSRVKAKGYILMDSILNHRTNAAIIIVSTITREGEESNQAISECRDFIKTISPILSNHIPSL